MKNAQKFEHDYNIIFKNKGKTKNKFLIILMLVCTIKIFLVNLSKLEKQIHVGTFKFLIYYE